MGGHHRFKSCQGLKIFFFDPHLRHDDYASKFTVDSPISALGDTKYSQLLILQKLSSVLAVDTTRLTSVISNVIFKWKQ